MQLFFRKRRGYGREGQPKEEPAFPSPGEDTSYCCCGAETILCCHCWRVYCACCDLSHVGEDVHGKYWACDYFV